MSARSRRPLIVAGMMLATAAVWYLPSASAESVQAAGVQREPVVAGQRFRPVKPSSVSTGRPFTASAPVWPQVSEVDVDLPSAAARAAGSGKPAAVPGLPVTVDPVGSAATDTPTKVRVRSFDRAATEAAGVNGILLSVARSDGRSRSGSARVAVDYSGFRGAYGGDWTSRLQLTVLPECALTTPGSPACVARNAASKNDARTSTVSADVSLPATGSVLVAVTASASGSAGSYQVTSLAPSGTWSGGASGGSFNWSYPLRMPPSLGGPVPTVELSYSSAGIDGQMATANSQPSWIGEGFDFSPGFIERRYNVCAEDMGSGANNTVKTGDLCFDTDNAALSLPGHAGELIRQGTTNRWHLRNDDGTYVERRTGGGNGVYAGEYWVVYTPEGTQYSFGNRTGSNSTLAVPVYGNHVGEPCYSSSFAASSCTQGWRWQLDTVVDPNGNTMTLNYAKETNYYGRNGSTTNVVQYDRAGYLTSIDYGTRTGSTGSAPMRVEFEVADRCLANCGVQSSWPDTPLDQECAASPCTNSTAVSFWTKKRLSRVVAKVWDTTAARYRDVESWTLTHSFPDPEDVAGPKLWLEKISHSGHVGVTTPLTLPDVSFQGVVMANRVDTLGDQYPAMKRFRMKTITTETGGTVTIDYSEPECVADTKMPDPTALQNNTLRCFPVKWIPEGRTTAIDDYFHKYVVTEVEESDIPGSAAKVVTRYEYVGAPVWHYTDDDGLINTSYKTWSVWRGYDTVRTIVGEGTERTRVDTKYFRGMHGDNMPAGTRSVQLPAIATGNIPAVNDEDAYAGMVRESITYNGYDGAEVSATVYEPWQSTETASRTVNGFTVYARFTGTAAEHTRTTMGNNRPARTSTTRVTFDGYGMPISTNDAGDNAVNNDQQCTLTDYVRNANPADGIWIIDTVSRVRTYAVDCTGAGRTGLTDNDIIDIERTSYDQLAWNTAPTKGLVSQVEALKAWNNGAPTYTTVSRLTYDSHGRVASSIDIRGNQTTTSYTPASGGPVTETTETLVGPGWVTRTALEPAWNAPTQVTDPNGRVTEQAYDALGRRAAVWLPGWDRSAHPTSPSLGFDYAIRNNAPSVVTSRAVNPAGGYFTSYDFFDGLMRARQTQAPDEALSTTTAVVTDTFYDSAGRVAKVHRPYVAAAAPSANLFVPTGNIPSLDVTQYDGADREVAVIHLVDGAPTSSGGTERWRTTFSYDGDRVNMTPPGNDTRTTSITDIDGNVTESRQYHAGAAAGGNTPANYDATTHSYNRKGQLERTTDPGGISWTFGYDLKGRLTSVASPDKGTTTTTYNDYGDLLTVTDAANRTLTYTYDAMGRKHELWEGSTTTGTRRAEWTYDTLADGTLVRGQPVKSIRYVGTDQYVKEVLGYTVNYQPTSVRYSIPVSGVASAVTGTYTYVATYKVDGSPETVRIPSAGDPNIGVETLTFGYNSLGSPTTLSTSLGLSYVTGTDYTSYGEVNVVHLRHNSGPIVDVGRSYEVDTRRLSRVLTMRAAAPTTVADVRFTYDAPGNVTNLSDVVANDHQCFSLDYLQRLTDAWTPGNGDCTVPPTASALGGPARYWHTYAHNTTGSRTSFIEHATAAGDRTTTYTVAAGNHRLASSSSSDTTGTRTVAYAYDTVGNMRNRPAGSAGDQTLNWDAEGLLTSSQDASGTTQYIYDADGNRLVSKDPAGTTLSLPGQDVRYTPATGKRVTRYYEHGGSTVATRSGTSVTWLVDDHQGTSQTGVNASTQAIAVRRQTPYGASRTGSGIWPSSMDKGFVGGTKDNTGLTHLDAREYDPAIGRFVSVDPILDLGDSQQMNGYNYANNSPTTLADPNGLLPGCAGADGIGCRHPVSQQGYANTTDGRRAYNNGFRKWLNQHRKWIMQQRAARIKELNRQRNKTGHKPGCADGLSCKKVNWCGQNEMCLAYAHVGDWREQYLRENPLPQYCFEINGCYEKTPWGPSISFCAGGGVSWFFFSVGLEGCASFGKEPPGGPAGSEPPRSLRVKVGDGFEALRKAKTENEKWWARLGLFAGALTATPRFSPSGSIKISTAPPSMAAGAGTYQAIKVPVRNFTVTLDKTIGEKGSKTYSIGIGPPSAPGLEVGRKYGWRLPDW